MKKLITLLALAFCLGAKAQYTKLLDFVGTTTSTLTANGGVPFGSLLQASDGMLYGMTYSGGANDSGIIFQYNPAYNILMDMLDFAGTTNGKHPLGSLMQASDGTLYGMTEMGGSNGNGVLFQYNPTAASCIDRFDFATQSLPLGSTPLGSLMQASDGMFYGMSSLGGTSDNGVIFQYNPTTSIYAKKFDFASINGKFPYSSLIQASDGMLYGMTTSGGAGGTSGLGVLFKYNPTTSNYINILDFAGINGESPRGALLQASDGMLYGMTITGGANNMGVLFQYNPVTNTYIKMVDFNGTNGQNPNGSLIQASDGMLYGMTAGGGANSSGTLFQYNPVTNTLIDKFDFDGITNGSSPQGDLMQASDGMLYGMTSDGGVSNLGVLFKYGIGGTTGISQILGLNSQISIYPNPNSGSFVIEPQNTLYNVHCTVYDVNGKAILSQTVNGKTNIDASSLNEGVYNINLQSNEGAVNKRLIIVR